MNFEDIKIGDYITVTKIQDRADSLINIEILKVLAKQNPFLSCDRIYPVGNAKILNLNLCEVMILPEEFVKSIKDSKLEQIRIMIKDFLKTLSESGILI